MKTNIKRKRLLTPIPARQGFRTRILAITSVPGKMRNSRDKVDYLNIANVLCDNKKCTKTRSTVRHNGIWGAV